MTAQLATTTSPPSHRHHTPLADSWYCPRCRQTKPNSAFRPDPTRVSGLARHCTGCEGIKAPEPEDELVTLAQAAVRLGLRCSTVYQWYAGRRLPRRGENKKKREILVSLRDARALAKNSLNGKEPAL